MIATITAVLLALVAWNTPAATPPEPQCFIRMPDGHAVPVPCKDIRK
jgi:hypothetical protein